MSGRHKEKVKCWDEKVFYQKTIDKKIWFNELISARIYRVENNCSNTQKSTVKLVSNFSFADFNIKMGPTNFILRFYDFPNKGR